MAESNRRYTPNPPSILIHKPPSVERPILSLISSRNFYILLSSIYIFTIFDLHPTKFVCPVTPLKFLKPTQHLTFGCYRAIFPLQQIHSFYQQNSLLAYKSVFTYKVQLKTMNNHHQLLNEINPTKDHWRIKVRISRMWHAIDFKKNDEIRSLDMLLLDANNVQIYCSIFKNLIEKFKHLLHEGEVYVIEKFNVAIHKGNFRPNYHDYRIYFKWNTIVKPMNDPTMTFPKYKFYLVEFDGIPCRYQVDTYLTDVIGKLISITHLDIIHKKNGNDATKRGIVIANTEGKSIKITLWGDAANQIPTDIANGSTRPIIVIVTSTFVKKFGGEYHLSSTTTSKVYINLEIPEFGSFMDSLVGLGQSEIKTLPSSQQGVLLTEELMFVQRQPLVEIILAMKDDSSKVTTFTCKATICKVNTDFGWHYLSCTVCRKKVHKKETIFWCNSCTSEVNCPTPRYMLRIHVYDYTSRATFVIFDKEAEFLIKHPIQNLLEINERENGANIISSMFDALLGKMFIFQVKKSQYNASQKYISFTVCKVFDVIHKLESQYCVDAIDKEHSNSSTNAKEKMKELQPSSGLNFAVIDKEHSNSTKKCRKKDERSSNIVWFKFY